MKEILEQKREWVLSRIKHEEDLGDLMELLLVLNKITRLLLKQNL